MSMPSRLRRSTPGGAARGIASGCGASWSWMRPCTGSPLMPASASSSGSSSSTPKVPTIPPQASGSQRTHRSGSKPSAFLRVCVTPRGCGVARGCPHASLPRWRRIPARAGSRERQRRSEIAPCRRRSYQCRCRFAESGGRANEARNAACVSRTRSAEAGSRPARSRCRIPAGSRRSRSRRARWLRRSSRSGSGRSEGRGTGAAGRRRPCRATGSAGTRRWGRHRECKPRCSTGSAPRPRRAARDRCAMPRSIRVLPMSQMLAKWLWVAPTMSARYR